MRRKILLLRNNKTTRLPFVLFVTVIIFVTHFITDIIVRHETIDNETFHFSSIDKTSNENDTLDDENWIPQTIQFTGFDNAHGAENSIIPNIIHFIRYDKRKLSFAEYIVVLAAMRNHKPDRFFFHSNIPDFKTTGKYWNLIRDDHDLWSRIHFKYLEAPKEIFGKPLSERWRLHHGSDIGRLKVLMKYGGIYLDNDVYIVKSLEKYLKYECVINWEENQFMNTQVIIAHKDARFLHAWLETYKSYNSSRWYYNTGERPTIEILYHHPELVHRVKGDFGSRTSISASLYKTPGFEWRKLDTVHLFINNRPYMDPNYNETREFDETNIQSYNYPFGEMAREIISHFTPS